MYRIAHQRNAVLYMEKQEDLFGNYLRKLFVLENVCRVVEGNAAGLGVGVEGFAVGSVTVILTCGIAVGNGEMKVRSCASAGVAHGGNLLTRFDGLVI